MNFNVDIRNERGQDGPTRQGSFRVQIEMFEAEGEQSFSGGPELHVRVLSDALVDIPRVKLACTAEQRTTWASYWDSPSYYYPADTTKESHGFKYDDEWHFQRRANV